MARAAGLVAVLALGLLGCSSEPPVEPTRAQPSTPARCTLNSTLVPSCGVLLGVSTQPATTQAVADIEKEIGRTFDLVYRYHDLGDDFPDAEEKAAIAQGRLLHVALAARFYDQPDRVVTYAEIASGSLDRNLKALAAGLAGLKVPVYVTFEQEANQRKKLDVRGSAEDFKAAWRHVHEVFTGAGATNAVWVWVMTGAEDNLERAGTIWPGNDVVDWISWNVYNGSGCNSGRVKPGNYRTVSEAVAPFYQWVHKSGRTLGIDSAKPMMISEMGSVMYRGDTARTADWYSQIPTVLREYPQIKAVTLWASSTSKACNYRFQDVPEVLTAVELAASSPLFRERIDVPAYLRSAR